MKILFAWLGFLALVLAPMSAFAGKNKEVTLVEDETIALLSPQNITTWNPTATKGYLIIETSDEVASASLNVIVYCVDDLGLNFAIGESGAITTSTTTVVALGLPGATAAGHIDTVVEFPLCRHLLTTHAVTGADASFTVDSVLHLLAD